MHGIPTYSGPVKSDFFRGMVLPHWNPDVIIMCTFGQLIDEPIINFPEYGMYNFHPSDLANGKYPGPNPFQEMIDAGEETTRMTLHHVSQRFDEGEVVGFSPPIRITHADGSHPDVPYLHHKTSPAAGIMAVELVRRIQSNGDPVTAIDFSTVFSLDEQRIFMRVAA